MRLRIFDFMKKISKSLARVYLEYLIEESLEETAVFHENMCFIYIDDCTQDSPMQASKRRKLQKFLESSCYYHAQTVLGVIENTGKEKCIETKN